MNADTKVAVQKLRSKFLDKVHEEQKNFHPKDMTRVSNDDVWLKRFLTHNNDNVDDALNMMIQTCEWRKNNKVNDISENNVKKEYLEEGSLFIRNKDKDGHPLLIFKCAKHVKGTKNFEELKKCVVYWFERAERCEGAEQITIFMDMCHTGMSNMDTEYTKYLINLCKQYYPNFLNYILIFEMPWVLNTAFVVIKSFLPSSAVQKIKFVTKSSLEEYVEKSQALVAWGGTDSYTFTLVPMDQAKVDENKKKVHFADGSPLTETTVLGFGDESQEDPLKGEFKICLKQLVIPKGEGGNYPSNMDSVYIFIYGLITDLVDRYCNRYNKKNEDVDYINVRSKKKFANAKSSRLSITPSDVVTFKLEFKELMGVIKIKNTSDIPVSYKIKTTSPEKFKVRPSLGMLSVGASTTIDVTVISGYTPAQILRDKFLVLNLPVETPQNIVLSEFWRNYDTKSLEQHFLKCKVAPMTQSPNGTAGSLLTSEDLPSPISTELEEKIAQLLISGQNGRDRTCVIYENFPKHYNRMNNRCVNASVSHLIKSMNHVTEYCCQLKLDIRFLQRIVLFLTFTTFCLAVLMFYR